MTKKTEYSIKYFHFSHGEAMEGLAELCGILETLLPQCHVDYESCKSDFGLLTITVEEAYEDGDYK